MILHRITTTADKDEKRTREASDMGESATNLWGMAFDDDIKADEARALYRRMAGEGLLAAPSEAGTP